MFLGEGFFYLFFPSVYVISFSPCLNNETFFIYFKRKLATITPLSILERALTLFTPVTIRSMCTLRAIRCMLNASTKGSFLCLVPDLLDWQQVYTVSLLNPTGETGLNHAEGSSEFLLVKPNAFSVSSGTNLEIKPLHI